MLHLAGLVLEVWYQFNLEICAYFGQLRKLRWPNCTKGLACRGTKTQMANMTNVVPYIRRLREGGEHTTMSAMRPHQ